MKYSRPYDRFMSDVVRQSAMLRREAPDGVRHSLRVSTRGPSKEEHYEYPWAKMKLGDYFVVPLRGRRSDALAVRFRQAAAQRDWELAIARVDVDGEPHLRVCLTVVDVSKYKRPAQIPQSDGKWLAQRKLRYQRKKAAAPSSSSGRTSDFESGNGGSNPPEGTTIGDNIVTFPEQQSVVEDESLSPNYDRGEVIKRRLAALGISQ